MAPRVSARLLSAPDAAVYIGRSEDAIRQMAYRRQIPFVKQGRVLRFDVRELDRWIDDHTVASEAS